jgi:hypothetical protein
MIETVGIFCITTGKEVTSLAILFALFDVKLKFGISWAIGEMNHPIGILIPIDASLTGGC